MLASLCRLRGPSRLALTRIAVVFAVLASGPAGGAMQAPAPDGPAPALVRLFDRGQPFDGFLASVQRRADAWRATYASAEVDPQQVARARPIAGRWRLLVVAVDGCSDSVSTLPYIAKLDAALDMVDLRIVDSHEGLEVMRAHRTPDGRAATPTMVLLDAGGREAGCWVERPSALQSWVLGDGADLPADEVYQRKMAWYRADAGRETVRELVDMLEAAAAGRPSCGSPR
jgi:hypothetical protein